MTSNDECKEFNDKNEFMEYYKSNIEELKSLKSKELNNMFKINGLKIIKNKGNIAFRRIKGNKDKVNNKRNKLLDEEDTNGVSDVSKNNTLNDKIQRLNDVVNNMQKEINECIDIIKKLDI